MNELKEEISKCKNLIKTFNDNYGEFINQCESKQNSEKVDAENLQLLSETKTRQEIISEIKIVDYFLNAFSNFSDKKYQELMKKSNSNNTDITVEILNLKSNDCDYENHHEFKKYCVTRQEIIDELKSNSLATCTIDNPLSSFNGWILSIVVSTEDINEVKFVLKNNTANNRWHCLIC